MNKEDKYYAVWRNTTTNEIGKMRSHFSIGQFNDYIERKAYKDFPFIWWAEPIGKSIVIIGQKE